MSKIINLLISILFSKNNIKLTKIKELIEKYSKIF